TDLPKGAGPPRWSPDGRTIAFTSSSNPEDIAKQQKKKQKEEEAKKTAVAGSPSPAASAKPTASPSKAADSDEERESDVLVVTHAVYREDNEGNADFKRPQHIWTIPAPKTADENAKPRNLTTQFDYDVGQGVFGDQAPPRAGGDNPPIWSADSKNILQLFGREGRTNLGRFDAATGVLTEITKGDHAVLSFRATADNSKVVCL